MPPTSSEPTEAQKAEAAGWAEARCRDLRLSAKFNAEGLARDVLPLIQARDEARANNQRVMCSYCGHVTEHGSMSMDQLIDAMVEHMAACSRHPFKKAYDELEAERALADWLAEELQNALAYIRECEKRKIPPHSDGMGYEDAAAALAAHAAARGK